MAGFVPALPGHVELQRERRLVVAVAGREVPAGAAGAFERLDLADEDAVHQARGRRRERRGARASAGCCSACLRRAIGRGRGSARRSRISTRTKRGSRASSSTGNDFLMTRASTACAGCMPMDAGTGDAARGQHELLEPRLMGGRPVDLFIGLDQGLDEHLAVSPVLELVLQAELERADRRRVGDRATCCSGGTCTPRSCAGSARGRRRRASRW